MDDVLYNEIEPYAADWLENLIVDGHIAPGVVDRRDIRDLTPDYVSQFVQFHAFAGIGVWSYALRRAGWPDDRPVWTGSCPCQPFSAAGRGGGVADERHLWPHWFHLIDVCRPPEVFGEQVASKDGLGWLDLVSADMEGADYAFGAQDRCSAGFGAPHIRQRLSFVGTHGLQHAAGDGWIERWSESSRWRFGRGRGQSRLGLATGGGRERFGQEPEYPFALQAVESRAGRLANRDDALWGSDGSGWDFGDRSNAERQEGSGDAEGRGGPVRMGNAERIGAGRHAGASLGPESRTALRAIGHDFGPSGAVVGLADDDERLQPPTVAGLRHQQYHPEPRSGFRGGLPSPTNGFWRDVDWLFCRDGKWRPVEPGAFPLAHGAASRVGRLRAYGNAIEAENQADFIATFLESEAAGHADLVDCDVDLIG